MFDYAQAAATALRLIQQFGGQFPLVRNADSVAGATGTVTRTPTTYTINAAITPISLSSPQGLDDRYKEAWVQGKLRMLLVAAGVVEPRAGDKITIGADVLTVLGCTPVDPSGTHPVVYAVGAASR